VIFGLGSLITKVAAAAVIPRIVKALSALGGPTEPTRANPSQPEQGQVSAPVRSPEKSLYGEKLLVRHTRAYDAANRRWISRDPLGEGVDYNLYRYCGNSPINCSDPSGLDPWYKDPTFQKNPKLFKWKLEQCPVPPPEPDMVDAIIIGTPLVLGAIEVLPLIYSRLLSEAFPGTGLGFGAKTVMEGRVPPSFTK